MAIGTENESLRWKIKFLGRKMKPNTRKNQWNSKNFAGVWTKNEILGQKMKSLG